MENLINHRCLNYVEDLESAKYYDSLPRFSKTVYDYLESIGICKKVIADVGCGNGRITIDLLERNNTVYAIDPDVNMRTICEEKCGKFKEKFISVDGIDSDMNIPDKSVDYVIVVQTLHRFDIEKFKRECERVLKNKDNVVIIWYRINFNDPIFSDMLSSIKKNYSLYKSRYDTDEVTGARKEEEENNAQVLEFFNGNSHMENVLSKALLSFNEFLTLGLSLALFPITNKMNTVSKVLNQKSFKKDEYINDLKDIFNKYSENGKIELKFNVQIHSHI